MDNSNEERRILKRKNPFPRHLVSATVLIFSEKRRTKNVALDRNAVISWRLLSC